MRNKSRFHRTCFSLAVLPGLLSAIEQAAFGDPVALSISGMVSSSNVGGVSLGAGDYTAAQLGSIASAVGTTQSNGLAGVSLWSLLGGNAAGASNVVTSTPAGDNGKNAILRSYVLATSVTGVQELISLGEIDPFFGGTGSTPDFLAIAGSDGKPELVFPGTNASGRNFADLASLKILAAPALTNGVGGVSSSLTLTGTVALPGTYTLADLQRFPSRTLAVSGDDYTGVPLWTFLNSIGNPATGYVLASGTDGYQVLYSLAELNPALGAPEDLIPYADTQGQFPGDGFARIVIPGDNHAGRYVSNLDAIAVLATPEPGTAVLFALSLVALGMAVRKVSVSGGGESFSQSSTSTESSRVKPPSSEGQR